MRTQPEPRRRVDGVSLTFAFLLVLAFGLRLYRIDVQSLWSDEGNSVALAQRSLARIARDSARDIHPPFYYWTLHFWVKLSGTGEAAVRSLSAVYGALTVALTFVLGRRLFGDRAALVATTMAAVSPLAIHYSQETRMYMLVTLLGALTWLLILRWVERPSGGRLLLYGVAALLTIYTHYFGIALIAAVNLVSLIWLVRQSRLRWKAHAVVRATSAYARTTSPSPPRGLRGRLKNVVWQEAPAWLLLHAALMLAYLPRVWHSRDTIADYSGAATGAPAFVLRDTLRAFSLGLVAERGWLLWATLFGGLVLAGLVARPRRRMAVDSRIVAAAWLLVPITLMVVLSLGRDYYHPRFLLLALPAFHLLVGHGTATIGEHLRAPKLIAVTVAGLLLVAARGSLQAEWTDRRTWRDDYRGIARTVTATAGPDDAVLILGPGQIEIFDYYYRDALPRYPLPRTRPIDPEATVRELEQIAARHRRLYAVFWGERESDPDGVVASWLQEHAFRISDRWYGTVRLVQYEFGTLRDKLEPRTEQWEGGIRLARAAVDPPSVFAGDVVRVALEWQTSAPPGRPLQVFAQILDEADNIVGQYDGPAAQQSSESWLANEPQYGLLGVQVRPGTPPGDYWLIAGLYDAVSFERLKLVSGADWLRLTTVNVERPPVPPTPESLDLSVYGPVRIGDSEILGWRFNRLGSDHDPQAPIHPGEALNVVLFWRAGTDAPSVPALRLQIRDERGGIVAEWPWTPAGGRYAPDRWIVGEVVRDPQVYSIPGNLAGGRYRLVLAEDVRTAVLGDITVR